MTAAPVAPGAPSAALPRETDPRERPRSDLLVDAQGRRMSKLRLSLTSRCDLACVYCRSPGEDGEPEHDLLAPAEIARLVGTLVECGIETVRATGGEPLLRRDLPDVLSALEGVPVAKAITTNGQLLSRRAPLLARSGFSTANVSLDSLDPERFRDLTGGGSLRLAWDGILAARGEGMEVKINCVAMAGINDGEIAAFHDLAASTGIEVRFLELLKAGPGRALHARHFLSAHRVRSILEAHAGALEEIPSPPDSTVLRAVSGAGARIGFMASESKPFCGSCSRLRLSSRGVLHPCLFGDDGVDLRGAPAEEIPRRVREALRHKPSARLPETARSLRNLGG